VSTNQHATTPTPDGVPFDDLFTGRRYLFTLTNNEQIAGRFVRLAVARGQPLAVVFSVTGGRQKGIVRHDILRIDYLGEPKPPQQP